MGAQWVEVVEIVGLQSVLILSGAAAAADAEILHGLKIENAAPGTFEVALRMRAMTSSALILRSLRGLSWPNMRAVLPPLPPPVKEVIVSTAGSFKTISVKVAHLLRHRRERQVLVALDDAADAAGILLGKKPELT